MEKPTHHIFVCGSFRTSGEPKGICHKKGSLDLLGYIENEVIDRSMDGILVSSTGCLKVCDRGPALVVYPQNVWYGGVDSEDVVDEILDALEDGEVAEKYLIT
ncbi:MAG: (2Fe-2S) ferredoxin domain-containing protein [Deltaproteobacteria bacterium]|nr:(2Fe-2S) ferredoxin domain-containing protein [Deltaproteobacteria bacterium]